MTVKPSSKYISLPETSTPSTPSASNVKLFADTGKRINIINSSATVTDISGGAFESSDLTDVTVTTPSNGDYLVYSGGTWINQALPSIPTVVSDLSDVNTTGVIAGDVLVNIGGTFYAKRNQPALSVIALGSGDIGYAVPDDGAGVSILRIGSFSGRRGAGDTELYEDAGAGSLFIPISDTEYDDHGLYIMKAWFRWEFAAVTAGGSITGTIDISWVNLDNLTIDEEVPLWSQNAAEGVFAKCFTFPFKSDATVPASVRRYAFRITTTDTAASAAWYAWSIEKVSHAYA